MVNKYILGLIILCVLAAAGYFAWTFQKENHNTSTWPKPDVEDSDGKPVVQSHRSYELEVTSKLTAIKPGQPATITYKIKNDQGKTIKEFEVVHEKIMHFITGVSRSREG